MNSGPPISGGLFLSQEKSSHKINITTFIPAGKGAVKLLFLLIVVDITLKMGCFGHAEYRFT